MKTWKNIILLLISFLITYTGDIHGQNHTYAFDVTITGEGSDVLLIPGLGSPGEVWQPISEELGDSYRLHILSLPGFAGHAPVDFGDSFIATMRKEIVTYLQQEQLKDPIIMGHSLGGFLALDIASRHSQLVSGIISVDGVPFLPAMQNPALTEKSAAEMAENMINQRTNSSPEELRQMQERIIKTMVTDPDDQQRAVTWSLESDEETFNQAIYDLYTTDLRDDISAIDVPVLTLGSWIAYKNYGLTKSVAKTMYEQQYKAVDDVSIRISDKGRHFLMWDDADFVVSSFCNFMRSSGS